MPFIRGNAMKQLVGRLEHEGHVKILSAVHPDTLERVERATRLTWLPLKLNEEIVAQITAQIGVSEGEALFHRVYAEVLETPMFAALLHGVRALGARSPGAFLKHAPRGYAANFRDVGYAEVADRSEQNIRIEYHELPPHLFAPELCWVRYAAASLLSAFDFSGVPGSYRFVEREPDRGFAAILYEW